MRCVGRPSMRAPSKRTSPERGATRPRITFIVVDLPLALPPSRQTMRPCADFEREIEMRLHRAVEGVDAVEREQRPSSFRGLRSRGALRADAAVAQIGLDHGGIVAHRVPAGRRRCFGRRRAHRRGRRAASPCRACVRSAGSSGPRAFSAPISASISAVSVGFMPAVGSSSSSSRGRSASARAISTRRRLA